MATCSSEAVGPSCCTAQVMSLFAGTSEEAIRDRIASQYSDASRFVIPRRAEIAKGIIVMTGSSFGN